MGNDIADDLINAFPFGRRSTVSSQTHMTLLGSSDGLSGHKTARSRTESNKGNHGRFWVWPLLVLPSEISPAIHPSSFLFSAAIQPPKTTKSPLPNSTISNRTASQCCRPFEHLVIKEESKHHVHQPAHRLLPMGALTRSHGAGREDERTRRHVSR